MNIKEPESGSIWVGYEMTWPLHKPDVVFLGPHNNDQPVCIATFLFLLETIIGRVGKISFSSYLYLSSHNSSAMGIQAKASRS